MSDFDFRSSDLQIFSFSDPAFQRFGVSAGYDDTSGTPRAGATEAPEHHRGTSRFEALREGSIYLVTIPQRYVGSVLLLY